MRKNFSDKPSMAAKDVDYYPSSEELSLIREWCQFMISKALVDYYPPMKTCKKFIKYEHPSLLILPRSNLLGWIWHIRFETFVSALIK